MGFCHFWIFMVWWDLVWWYFQSLFRHLLVLWKYCRVTFKPCKTNQPDRQSHDQWLQKLDHLSRFLIVQSCLNGWFAYILHPKLTKHDQISGFIELPSASCWKPLPPNIGRCPILKAQRCADGALRMSRVFKIRWRLINWGVAAVLVNYQLIGMGILTITININS